MNGTPPAKRLYCTEEERETTFQRAGENMARVPVWVCRSCGAKRSGFFAAKPNVDVTAVATDGGSSGGGGGGD